MYTNVSPHSAYDVKCVLFDLSILLVKEKIVQVVSSEYDKQYRFHSIGKSVVKQLRFALGLARTLDHNFSRRGPHNIVTLYK